MIGTAVQKGDYVYVYDEKGHQLTYQRGQLQGDTGSSFSIRNGDYVYVYDEKGHQMSYHRC